METGAEMMPVNMRKLYERLLGTDRDWRVVSVHKICDGRYDVLVGLYEKGFLMHTSTIPVGDPALICLPSGSSYSYLPDTL